MEFPPEKEPLLNKEDKDTYLKIEDISSCQKSKEQVINCQDCLELLCFCCYNYDVTQREYESHLALSNRCSIKYDKEDPLHEKLLLDFFENIKELNSEENKEDCENAENDKKEREMADKINEADNIIFQSEKQLKDYGDKIPADVKSKIEEDLANLRKSKDEKNISEIDKHKDKLMTDLQEIYKAMQNAQTNTNTNDNSSSNNSSENNTGENVQEANYEEVK